MSYNKPHSSNYQKQGGNKNSQNNNKGDKETLKEILEKIKTKYFKETYDNLLSLKKENTNLDTIYDKISDFVKEEGKNITTSQLRNIYGEIKRAKDVPPLKMLRPNLAYIAAREKNARNIVMFFEKLIKEVNNKEELESFQIVMEAVVAYHKFHHNKK